MAAAAPTASGLGEAGALGMADRSCGAFADRGGGAASRGSSAVSPTARTWRCPTQMHNDAQRCTTGAQRPVEIAGHEANAAAPDASSAALRTSIAGQAPVLSEHAA